MFFNSFFLQKGALIPGGFSYGAFILLHSWKESKHPPQSQKQDKKLHTEEIFQKHLFRC